MIMDFEKLANLNQIVRDGILKAMSIKNMSLNAFAKNAGVHQNQLWLYLYSNNEKKGMHSNTIEKVCKYLATLPIN